jgi:hypothetical protein
MKRPCRRMTTERALYRPGSLIAEQKAAAARPTAIAMVFTRFHRLGEPGGVVGRSQSTLDVRAIPLDDFRDGVHIGQAQSADKAAQEETASSGETRGGLFTGKQSGNHMRRRKLPHHLLPGYLGHKNKTLPVYARCGTD